MMYVSIHFPNMANRFPKDELELKNVYRKIRIAFPYDDNINKEMLRGVQINDTFKVMEIILNLADKYQLHEPNTFGFQAKIGISSIWLNSEETLHQVIDISCQYVS